MPWQLVQWVSMTSWTPWQALSSTPVSEVSGTLGAHSAPATIQSYTASWSPSGISGRPGGGIAAPLPPAAPWVSSIFSQR